MFSRYERVLIQGASFLFKGGSSSVASGGFGDDAAAKLDKMRGIDAAKDPQPVSGAVGAMAPQPQKTVSIPGQQLYATTADDKKKVGRKMTLMRGGMTRL